MKIRTLFQKEKLIYIWSNVKSTRIIKILMDFSLC